MNLRSERQRQLVRSRVQAGTKYIAEGDAFTRSFGDWNNVLAGGAAFAVNPLAAGRDEDQATAMWVPPSTYVPGTTEDFPVEQLVRAGQAAFAYWAFPENATYQVWGQRVRQLLLQQVAVGGWVQPEAWAGVRNFDAGTFEAIWLVRFCYCLDAIRPLLTMAEWAHLTGYVQRWKRFYLTRLRSRYISWLPGWDAGDWSQRRSWASPTGERSQPVETRIFGRATDPVYQTMDAQGYMLTHVGGNRVPVSAWMFNNRADAQAHFVFVADYLCDLADGVLFGRRYDQASTVFGSWADGTHREWNRNGRQLVKDGAFNPGFGALNYGYYWTEGFALRAYLLACAGDTSHFTWTTRDGAHGTQCLAGQPDKGLLTLLRRQANCVLGQSPLFWRATGDSRNVVDHRSEYNLRTVSGQQWPYESVFDGTMAVANTFYNDALLRQAYMRQGLGGYGMNRATAGKSTFIGGGVMASIVEGLGLAFFETETLGLFGQSPNVVGDGAQLAVGSVSHVLQAQAVGATSFAWTQTAGPTVALAGTNTGFLIVNPMLGGALPLGSYSFRLAVVAGGRELVRTVSFSVG